MLTKDQLSDLTKLYKINESVVLREYLQLLALHKIYSFSKKLKYIF